MAELGEVPFGKILRKRRCHAAYSSCSQAPISIAPRTGQPSNGCGQTSSARLQWIDEYGDVDGDGFVEYARHSNKGLVQQGWKDSNDSVFHADGASRPRPSLSAKCRAMSMPPNLPRRAWPACWAMPTAAASSKSRRKPCAPSSKMQFWCDDLGTYALALDGKKRPCRVRTSNAGHCLYTGIASPARARRVAENSDER